MREGWLGSSCWELKGVMAPLPASPSPYSLWPPCPHSHFWFSQTPLDPGPFGSLTALGGASLGALLPALEGASQCWPLLLPLPSSSGPSCGRLTCPQLSSAPGLPHPPVLRDGQVGARGEERWALPAVSPCLVPPCGDKAIPVACVWGGAPWEAGHRHRDLCGARMAASETHPDLLGTETSADATFSR